MSGRLSTPWVIVGVVMAGCAVGFMTLVAIGFALLGGGSDISQPGPFRAEAVAALPDRGIAVAGTGGMCGDLVLVRVAPDGAQRKTSVKAGKLGGDCVDGIASVTVWRGGIDVLAELKEETGGVVESDILEARGLARFKLDGKHAEGFGDKGVLKDLSGSVATSPDGSLADASGKRFFAGGTELTDAGQPLDIVPGEELIAPASNDRLLLAGQGRLTEDRDELLVARFTGRNALDRTFGAEGVVALPLALPRTVVGLRDGSTLLGSLGGAFVRLDPRGRLDRSYGDRGLALAFDRPAFARPAVGENGELALLAANESEDRFTIRRLTPRGRLDTRFAPAPLRSSAALAFDRAGRVLLLRGRGGDGSLKPTVIALGATGRRVSPLGTGPLSVELG